MVEFIEVRFLRAVIALAEELSYSRAAKKVSIPSTELRRQICELEKQLCFRIFRPKQKRVELTEDGKIFVRLCQRFLTQRQRPAESTRSAAEDKKVL